MDVDNNEVVLLRSNVHKVITAVTGNQMCHQSLVRENVPVNADVFVFMNKGTKKTEIAETTPE